LVLAYWHNQLRRAFDFILRTWISFVDPSAGAPTLVALRSWHNPHLLPAVLAGGTSNSWHFLIYCQHLFFEFVRGGLPHCGDPVAWRILREVFAGDEVYHFRFAVSPQTTLNGFFRSTGLC
jgi:hypothetical protein